MKSVVTKSSQVLKGSIVAVALAVCCHTETFAETKGNANWIKNGSISVSRPIPVMARMQGKKIFGFMPTEKQSSYLGSWIRINRENSSMQVMHDDAMLTEISIKGLERLSPGVYRVAHKQKDPLWHAPDSYFESRNLVTPSEGSKERFLRGALGKHALFLDSETPIHSGPLCLEVIGGACVSSLAHLYDRVETGTFVEIR